MAAALAKAAAANPGAYPKRQAIRATAAKINASLASEAPESDRASRSAATMRTTASPFNARKRAVLDGRGGCMALIPVAIFLLIDHRTAPPAEKGLAMLNAK